MAEPQFKLRRNAKGQFESVPEAEQGALRAAAEGIEPPSPAAGTVTQQDIDFVDGPGGMMESQPGAPPVQPPPLPPKAPPVEPPPLPPAQEEESAVGAAVGGATSGARFGAAGAVVGAVGGFVAAGAFKKSPIGSLEGTGQMGGGDQDVLRQLLEVQRGIARVGTPTKGAITTKSAGARL